MLEASLVAARLLQYAGAMILMGSSLFALYAVPVWPAGRLALALRKLLLIFAGTLLLATILGLGAQASVLAGSLSEGLRWETVAAVVTGMSLGKAALVRMLAATPALLVMPMLNSNRALAVTGAIAGVIAVGSLAWMGHAAASEGPVGVVHLMSDLAHVLAAAVWLGALAGFIILLAARPRSAEMSQAAYTALHGFSGVGAGAVIVLILSGLINSWLLVGPEHIDSFWNTRYGQLLSLKILLFLGMVALAAANRLRLTPALGRAMQAGRSGEPAIAVLTRSIILESSLGVGVLVCVAWLGTLSPPASM